MPLVADCSAAKEARSTQALLSQKRYALPCVQCVILQPKTFLLHLIAVHSMWLFLHPAVIFYYCIGLQLALFCVLINQMIPEQYPGRDKSSSLYCTAHGARFIQVLTGLSEDHAIAVLRCAPCALEEKLIQLPSLLRPLAGLAEVAGLVVMCSPVTEASELSSECPVLSLCVDCSQAQTPLTGAVAPEPSNSDPQLPGLLQDVVGAEMCPVVAAAEKNSEHKDEVEDDSVTPEQREHSIACSLLARARNLQGHTVTLPNTTCLVLGSSSGACHLQNFTFRGMNTPEILPNNAVSMHCVRNLGFMCKL